MPVVVVEAKEPAVKMFDLLDEAGGVIGTVAVENAGERERVTLTMGSEVRGNIVFDSEADVKTIFTAIGAAL